MINAVRARVNGEGRLVSADAQLLELQEQAGGTLGGPIALPALARLARLANRLETPIERQVLMADERHEIRAHGRFLPDNEGVRIELVDWEAIAAPEATHGEPLPPLPKRIIPPGSIRWACDIRLRLVMVEADPAWGLTDQTWMGRSMSELIHLMPDNDGSFPLLTALAEQADFIGQRGRVALGLADGTVVMLKANAMHDEADAFTGFYGDAAPVGFGQLPVDVAADQFARQYRRPQLCLAD